MRLRIRPLVSLLAGIILVSFLFALVRVQTEKRHLRNELERRTEVLAKSLEERVAPLLEEGSEAGLQRLVERLGHQEPPPRVAVYDRRGATLAMTPGLAARLNQVPATVSKTMADNQARGEHLLLSQTATYVYALPLRREQEQEVIGTLAVLDDAGNVETQSGRLWREALLPVLLQTLLMVLATLLIARWSIAGPIAKTAEWMRDLRMGKTFLRSGPPETELFQPLKNELAQYVTSLTAARAAAEEEARLREAAESLWTAERLRVHVQTKVPENRLFVVSNREPYVHVHRAKSVEAIVPPSGLVTALEPILRACDGTWVAHGSGDADRETVDAGDRLRVPPDEPQYTLRRVWLSKEEEQGYYLGFSNEGLWPLCHMAHTRPIFRVADWEHYQQVNRKFAGAVLEEMEEVKQPAVIVQDYHFALLPRLIKEKRPDARVAIFWHIPWPNPEAFSICPQQRELLGGLLGADLVGLHIQAHCTNFLETVDRTLESRIEWERFAVNRRGHLTLVRPFPISVTFPQSAPGSSPQTPGAAERETRFRELGVETAFLGVGVDRVDYTKGIIERFLGIERFLERHPIYLGEFTFVQIGAPSRTDIQHYHDLFAEVRAEAERINTRFASGKWKPIVLLDRHHSHREIERFYQAADLCLVTSLHDGMNLVAKEFVAARDDEQGVLILSRFTGASRELRDALLVNPYDSEQLAEAICAALEMDPAERKARMKRMRAVVKEHNVYRWAANLIGELAEIRLDTVGRDGAR